MQPDQNVGLRITAPSLLLRTPQSAETLDIAAFFGGKREIIVGREAGCGLSLDNEFVSRQHAKVFQGEGGFCVQDLASHNGTFLNGRRLPPYEVANLADGDRIDFGSSAVSVTFVCPGPVQAEEREEEFSISATITADRQAVLDSRVVPVEQKFKAILQILEDLRRAESEEQVCQALVDSLMKVFPGAERGMVLLCEAGAQHRVGAIRLSSAEMDETSMRYSRSLVKRVEGAGTAILSQDAPKDSRFDGTSSLRDAAMQSVMCVPLLCGGEAVGVVQLDAPRNNLFTEADLNLLVSMVYPGAVKLEERRIQSQLIEMEVARQVQMQILPAAAPQIPGYAFAHVYQPARAVGGDYFDYIPLAGDQLGLVLADVCGKGIPAALLSSKLSSEVRYILRSAVNLAEAAACLSQSVTGFAGGRFITCLLAILDVGTHELELLSAGHPWPLSYRAATGRVTPLFETQSPHLPLGVGDQPSYSTLRGTLDPGDMVLSFSDGVTEASDARQQLFGVKRTAEAFARAAPTGSPSRVCRDLCDAVSRHQGGSQQDDICIASFGRATPYPHSVRLRVLPEV
jgi:pSer/pThr/pTyr-binding forkhead associated (FHA) protein